MRRAMRVGMGLVLAGLFTASARAAVIQVPDPGNGIVSIQDGIDAAVDGDEVVVAPGTYGPVNFGGKAITVRSESGADATFIQGPVPAQDLVVMGGAPDGNTLRGFTVRTSMLASCVVLSSGPAVVEENVIEQCGDLDTGAGIKAYSSDAIIRNNTIRNNGVSRVGAGGSPIKGGGLYLSGGSPRVFNNFILDNHQSCGLGFCIDASGAGIYVTGGSPILFGNVLAGNATAPAAMEWGGAVYLTGTTGAVVANNTIYGNHASYDDTLPTKHGGGGLFIAGDNSSLLVTNNIVQANATVGVLCASASVDAVFETNSLFGNDTSDYEDCPAGTGDLFVDAQLADPAGDDFHLAETSPLLDAGTDLLSFRPPDLDIYGETRMTDGDGSGTVEIDIGASELPAAPVPGWAAAQPADAAAYGAGSAEGSRRANPLLMAGVPVLFGLLWRGLRRRASRAAP